MEVSTAKWIVEIAKENGLLGLISFQLIVIGLLIYAVRKLYHNNLDLHKSSNAALGDVKTTLNTLNTLVNLLVTTKRR